MTGDSNQNDRHFTNGSWHPSWAPLLVLCLLLLALAVTTDLTTGHVSQRNSSGVVATTVVIITAHDDQNDYSGCHCAS